MNEIAIIIPSLSNNYANYFYPSEVKEKKVGYGSSSRSLSGVPMEIVRGKRTESIILSFEKIGFSEYDFFLTLWEEGYSFKTRGMVPKISQDDCFIPIDGFGLEQDSADSYSGTITILPG